MEFWIHFAYPWILCTGIAVIFLAMLVRKYTHKIHYYRFSLTHYLKKNLSQKNSPLTFLRMMRIVTLLGMVILLARPRVVDHKSTIEGEGIDMVIALDVSNSMQMCDDPHDKRTRLDVAKEEAIKFIERREHDPIGLVIFGYDAVSRCPITLDKGMLKQIIKDTHLGVIDDRGTKLNTALIMAVNRLKHSKSKSKMIVLLTDGMPFEDDKTHEQAIAVAQKFGIKIYTIGIGHDGIAYVQTMLGLRLLPGVNKELLQMIAHQTGGRYFEAKKPQDMKAIYQMIDNLEKSNYETTIFTHYYDVFKPFLIGTGIVALIELLASRLFWVVI